MSGGVDSTVAAILLQKSGYSVEGVYMKLHNNEDYHKTNFNKAKRVAEYLNIHIHYLDITDEFNDRVYEYFIDSYKEGLTPNPCIVCNKEIKFGRLVEFADSLDIEYISTGHYVKSDGKNILMAKDQSKDQSYFLAKIRSKIIPRLIFPLGDMLKSEVKKIASNIPILLDIATQKESSEICFVEGEYTDLLKEHFDIDKEGEVLDLEGNVVGRHKGYMHYTIGKRRGFFVHGAHQPHYVLKLDSQKNQIVVGTKEYLSRVQFKIKDINMFEELSNFDCDIKVRYRTKAVPATVSIDGNKATVRLKEPVFGLASGQFAVMYNKDRLIGGGEIVA